MLFVSLSNFIITSTVSYDLFWQVVYSLKYVVKIPMPNDSIRQ